MEDLNGKGAFVTGGASGIGLGMARAFAANCEFAEPPIFQWEY